MTKKNARDASPTDTAAGVSRRGSLKLAGGSGVAGAAGAAAALTGVAKASPAAPDGTPEQIRSLSLSAPRSICAYPQMERRKNGP